MPEKTTEANYPDVLGYITGGVRMNIGPVQVAAASRPRIIRAGRPFEVIVLLQSAADIPLDVTITLKPPERDARGKKDRFLLKTPRLVVGLEAAETGYVKLPVTTLPDTAVGQDYKLLMQITVAPASKDKPRRVRLPAGGAAFDPAELKEETSAPTIEELKKLNFMADSQGGLRGTSLALTFAVMTGKVGTLTDLSPGWESLWTMRDLADDRVFLRRLGAVLKGDVLPQLDRTKLFAPLMEHTQKHFETAGFSLHPLEARLITKLLTQTLEFSSPQYGGGSQLVAGIYNIQPLLKEGRLDDDRPIILPRWTSRFLQALSRDERLARYPAQAIVRFAYLDLLRDAATRAFEMIEVATGQNVGTAEESALYMDLTISMMQRGELDFTHACMPLLLGGLIAFDAVMEEGEELPELLEEMRSLTALRDDDYSDETAPVFELVARLVEQALMKYDYRSR